MSIADKLLHLDETKALLRDAINRAGGGITSETPFRSYAGELDYALWVARGGLRSLFDSSEAGVLASDLPYFVDVDGETEATWGDPVGLIRDASPNRADFTQPTVTARPILGRVPRGGRRNLYSNSQPDIENSQWTTIRSGEGATVTRIGREPGPNGIDGIRYQFERPVSGYALVGGNLNARPAGDYTHSLWAKSGDGETYTIAFYTEAAQNLTFEVGPEWQRLVIPSYRDEDGGIRYRWFGLNNNAAPYNHFADIIIADGQFEIGEEATAFQQVITPYDITEEGVPEVHYLDFDLTDDNLTTTLPAIENGTVVIAGTNGIWIDDDYNFDGGTFSIGPTSYTGGPAGILEVIGEPIERGFLVINRQLSQLERDLVIQEMKERGAPGVFELGPELVTNGDFADGLTGWEQTTTAWSDGGGYAEADGSNGYLYQQRVVSPGTLILAGFYGAKANTSGYVGLSISNGGIEASMPDSSPGNRLFYAGPKVGISTVYAAARDGFDGGIDVFTVREITLNTGGAE